MEKWNMSYDVAALTMLVFFLLEYFKDKRFRTVLTKTFTLNVFLSALLVIVDFIGVVIYNNRTMFPKWVLLASVMSYYLIVCIDLYVFFIYIVLLKRNGRYTKHNWYWFVGYTPAVISIMLILVTPYYDSFVKIDDSYNILFGKHYIIMSYIASAYVLAIGIYFVAFIRKKVVGSPVTKFALAAGMLTANLTQSFYPEKRLVPFTIMLSITVIYFISKRNARNVSSMSGFLNGTALIEKFNEKENKNQHFAALCISMFGVENFQKQWGRYVSERIQKQMVGYISELAPYEDIFMPDMHTTVILFPADGDYYSKFDEIYDRFASPWLVDETEFSIDTYMCAMEWPVDEPDMTKFSELLENAIEFAEAESLDHVIYASEYRRKHALSFSELETRSKVLEMEKRKAEEAKDAAERADRSKSSFLAHMSHEIRTPLTAILGMTEIILRSETSPQVRRNILSIQSAGKSLLTIINDILDFSKIEAGKMELINEPYHLNSTLDAAFNTAIMKIGNKNIEFVANVSPNTPSMFLGDETRVRQVMLNFLTNAAKYTEMGRVTFNVNWDSMRGALNVSVTDTGRGISDEDKQKMFSRFERFETRENKAIEGTGLGLAISKMLIEQMGGQMLFESTYGKGSTFGFTIYPQVVDASPIARVDNPLFLYAAVLMYDREAAERTGKELSGMNIPYRTVADTGELEELLKQRRITHLITDFKALSDYKKTELYEKNKNAGVSILVYPEPDNEIRFSKEYTYIVYPFSCLSLAAAFLGNLVEENLNGNQEGEFFTAPEARILIVDDNVVNLQIAKELMAPKKMHIDLAESGTECLELSKKYKYDMIFLDHMMPVMDGIETLKNLRAHHENINCATPVIAFTANAVSGMREQFRENGFEDYLSKPINITKMEGLLRNYLPNEKLVFGPAEEKRPDEVASTHREFPSEIPGIDMNTGIANLGGDLEKYIRLLRIVRISGEEKAKRMDELFSEKDYPNYIIEAHALKSTMASIGALELSELAKSVELRGKQGDYVFVAENHERLYNGYLKIIETIEEYVIKNSIFDSGDTKEGKEAAKGSFDTCGEALRCVTALLREFENELAEKVLKGARAEFGKDAAEDLRQAMGKAADQLEVYDYDGAIETLQAFI